MLNIAIAWLFADFLSGIFHWWEDRYLTGKSGVRFIDKIAKDNELHHKSPTELTRHTYWYNINGSIQYSSLIAGILFLLSTHIVLCLGFFFLGFANLVHRFSHETRHRIPSLIRILQWSGVFISPDHHVIHHVDGRMLVSKKRAHREFCVMSNLLNPLLDKMKLWRRLERLVSLFGYDPI